MEVGDLDGEAVTRYNIAQIYRHDGRLAEAVHELGTVVELDRSLQHPSLKSDLKLLEHMRTELAASPGFDRHGPHEGGLPDVDESD
jgi:hypothetical protein